MVLHTGACQTYLYVVAGGLAGVQTTLESLKARKVHGIKYALGYCRDGRSVSGEM